MKEGVEIGEMRGMHRKEGGSDENIKVNGEEGKVVKKNLGEKRRTLTCGSKRRAEK